MDTITMTVHLEGFAPGAAPATLRLVRWTRRERLARAWRGLGACWGAALLAIFIPVAHFVLVPGLALAGPVLLVRRLRLGEAVRALQGSCPDCGTEGSFPVPGRLARVRETHCPACHRGLAVRR